MILAAYGDGLYKLLFLGHILSILVAFAPAVVNPLTIAKIKANDDETTLTRVAGHMASNGRQVFFPALIAIGAFGLGMVLTSDEVIGFGDTWVSLAFLVWLAICGIVTAIILPNERKLADGDLAAEKKVEVGGQLATVLVLVMLYLMIWKPGA